MYAAIRIPDFNLQACLRQRPDTAPDQPAAVLKEQTRHAVVHQANAAARRHGVIPGQTANQALARCADLTLFYLDPKADASASSVLFGAALSLSPSVEITSQDLLTVDLSGHPSAKRTAASRALIPLLASHGLEARIGLAPAPDWAHYAAYCAQPFLEITRDRTAFDALPIDAARPSDNMLRILASWGIRTIGAFAGLPRQGIGERLGQEGLALWDTLHSPRHRLLKQAPLPTVFEESLEFDTRLESLDALLFSIRRILDSLCLSLRSCGKSARAIRFDLTLEDHNHYRRSFRLPEATSDANRLFSLLSTHLEQVKTDCGITAVSIRASPTDAHARQLLLFQQSIADPWKLGQTLSELTGLVGSDNIGSPRLRDTYRPDAFQLVPLQTDLDPVETTPTDLPNPLPLRRMRPPIPIRVTLNGKIPVHIQSPEISGKIRDVRGPWLQSGDWWDSASWQRTEWDVSIEEHGLFRIFSTHQRWFLEGSYG